MPETIEFPPLIAPLDLRAHNDMLLEQNSGQSLTTPDLTKIDLTDVALAMYGKWPDEVKAVKANLSTLALDLSTAAKITEARSLRTRLILNPLAAARKVSAGIKSKMATTSKAVGAELEKIEAAYKEADALILPKIEAREAELEAERVRRQQEEEARKEKHRTNIAAIRIYVDRASAPGVTAERIAKGIAQLEALPTPTTEQWEEFAVPAASAICEAMDKMRQLHAKALADEAAEAERVRRAAELAEQERRLAAERAEIERQRAELEAARALQAQQQMDAPPAGPAGDGSQKPDDAAAIPGAEAGSSHTPQGANRDASAEQSHVAEGSASPTGRGADGPTACGAAPVSSSAEYTEGRASQQVLKAEPATADATDRDAPAMSSPSVGSMGAGQAADAAPAGVASVVTVHPSAATAAAPMVPSPGSVIVSVGAGPITMIEPAAPAAEASVTPTLKLGTICERLGFTVTADFLASLGFAASHERSAKLYHEGSWPHMKAKLIAHIEGLN